MISILFAKTRATEAAKFHFVRMLNKCFIEKNIFFSGKIVVHNAH
jgi:hypothetical protein